MVAGVGNNLCSQDAQSRSAELPRARDFVGCEESVLTGMPSTFCCSGGDILNVNWIKDEKGL